MKSVLEIVTILIFLFCITMLERMDKSCGYYLPPPAFYNINPQKNNPANSLIGIEFVNTANDPKAGKNNTRPHTPPIVTSGK